MKFIGSLDLDRLYKSALAQLSALPDPQRLDPCPDCGGFGRHWDLVTIGQTWDGNDEKRWMLCCEQCGHVYQEQETGRFDADDYYTSP